MKSAKRRIPILKTLIVAALLFSAVYIALCVPAVAESFLPAAQAMQAESCSYCPTVTAKGTIVKIDEQWFASVAVDEGEIASIQVGQRAELSGAAIPEGVFSGSVCSISDVAYTTTSGTGTVPQTVVDVIVEIDCGDTSVLRAGYSVTAQLSIGEEKEMNMLPYSVICQDDAGEYVYVLENGTAVRRDIVTGVELADKTEIVSGISSEDLVLTEPQGLSDGSRVRLGAADMQ